MVLAKGLNHAFKFIWESGRDEERRTAAEGPWIFIFLHASSITLVGHMLQVSFRGLGIYSECLPKFMCQVCCKGQNNKVQKEYIFLCLRERNFFRTFVVHFW